MSNNNEKLETIYINKIQNIVGIAMHGLFENILYLYENKDTFDDKKELDKIFEKYLLLLDYSSKSTVENLDDLIYECAVDRRKYKQKALDGLHGSYNLDFSTDTYELEEKSKGIYDESIEVLSENLTNDYIASLIDEELLKINTYDKFSLSSICSLTASLDKNVFENILIENISAIPSDIIPTFLDNLKIKANSIIKEYKLKEFKNAPLTTFDYYYALFVAKNQMIVALTFFDEVKSLFDIDILVKDNFFTLKKVILDNDESFIESISDRNDIKLDDLIDNNDKINLEISELNKTSDSFKNNPLHKYVDFLEEILFEDLHYFMQSIDNCTMGIDIKDEIVSTISNLTPPVAELNDTFDDFFKFLYKNEKKLTFSEKLIFYKSILSLIFAQLNFIDCLKGDIIVNRETLVNTIKKSYKFLDLDEIKLLSAVILK